MRQSGFVDDGLPSVVDVGAGGARAHSRKNTVLCGNADLRYFLRTLGRLSRECQPAHRRVVTADTSCHFHKKLLAFANDATSPNLVFIGQPLAGPDERTETHILTADFEHPSVDLGCDGLLANAHFCD
ncbi:hypothetical protein NKI59_32565 [Mesorhizobium sp. M0598]